MTIRQGPATFWGPLLLGMALLGLELGLGFGYYGSAPLYGSSPGVEPMMALCWITVGVVLALTAWGLARKWWSPAIGIGLLLAAMVVGILFAPRVT